MKTLIIGASGLVGYHLQQTTTSRGSSVEGTYRQYQLPNLYRLETTDQSQVQSLIVRLEPEVVFLPAFLSNVNYCETNPKKVI